MTKEKTLIKWSGEEETQMINEINSGKSISQIADIHQRSNNAIAMRLCDMGKRMIEQLGKTIQEAQKKLKLVSINEIENYIKRENDKKKKNAEEIKPEKKKEETIESVKIELKDLHTKYNLLEEKYNKLNHIDDKFNELNTKMDKILDLIIKDKKVKIKKS